MKLKTIKSKVIAAMLGCLVLGLGATLALMHHSFNKNAQVLATQAVSSAQSLFTISESREISKMAAVTATLNTNPQIGDALAKRDREKLFAITNPLFQQLKGQGITNWMFHTAQPGITVFLRLHNPPKFGDPLNRYMDKQVLSTHALVSGNELARAGFAVRTLAPVYSSKGDIAGYVEYGEELGQFIHAMQKQTGDNYGLLLNKKFVDRQFWADSAKVWHRRDNWDDAKDTLVLDKTTDSDDILKYDGDLSAVPAEGKVLERYSQGESVFVRGIFPIKDASGQNVGAIFVVRDITSFYQSLRSTENVLAVMIVAGAAVFTVFFVWLLVQLIFRRLEHMIGVATRVVGGDYETAIKVDSEDEVGQFEQLFEQFRQVFVHVLSQIPELHKK